MIRYLILFAIVCLGCREQRELRHYKFVASDPDVTPTEKAIVADKFAALFPSVPQYIPGDSVIKVEEIYDIELLKELNNVIDSLQKQGPVNHKAILDSIVKSMPAIKATVKTVRIRDTLKIPDGAIVYSLQQQLSISSTENASFRTQVKQEKENVAAEKEKTKEALKWKRWFWILVAVVGVGLVAGFVLKLKKII